MLTRLEVNGFKNLVDFALDFGPYTCIAGTNGVGKSNIFDAIRFLALLTEYPINQAALQIRNAGEETGDIADLLFSDGAERRHRMEFAAEMIVSREVWDDAGRAAAPSATFLRYTVAFRYAPPADGRPGGLVLEWEELAPIPSGEWPAKLRFPHGAASFRDRVLYNDWAEARGVIVTDIDEATGQAIIRAPQSGSPPARAAKALRTIIGTENTAATPTILAARREMQSWRILALEPAAMRRPDRYTQPPGIAANGAHLPATLQHLANIAHQYDDTPEALFGFVSTMLSCGSGREATVRVARDDARQLLSLEVQEGAGLILRGNAIADSALRFLALATLAEMPDEAALYCIEEPENGIHPDNLSALNRALHNIAVEVDHPVAHDNPLRQVIVTTHSPYFVQLQDLGELALAQDRMTRAGSDKIRRNLLQCYPCRGTWRCADEKQDGIYPGSLQSYLLPPEDAQIALSKVALSKEITGDAPV